MTRTFKVQINMSLDELLEVMNQLTVNELEQLIKQGTHLIKQHLTSASLNGRATEASQKLLKRQYDKLKAKYQVGLLTPYEHEEFMEVGNQLQGGVKND